MCLHTHTLSRCFKLALYTTQKEHYNDTAATFLLTEAAAAAAPLDTLSGNGKTEKCRRSAAVYK